MKTQKFLLVFIVTALVLGACRFNVNVDVDEEGSGSVISEARQVSGFDRIQLNGMGDVILTQGEEEALTIEAEDNILPRITTEVRGGVLYIGFDRAMLLPTRSIKYYLTMRDIRGLESRGASNIQAERIATDRLEIAISGTGNVNIGGLSADSLTVNISGAGNVNVGGETEDQRVNLSGAGNYNSEALRSLNARVVISGMGKVTLWVLENLDVTISGAGGVDYYGRPQLTQQISGLGNLKQLGEK